MLAAWRQKAPVGPELRAIWIGRLAAAKTRAEREAAISLLFELHAYSELLPTLRGLVEQDPQHWLWSFGEAAKATGRKAELVAEWARISNQPGTPALLRRQLAFSLLENGNKVPAEQAFRTLAAAAPPTSPDVRELLFIWGPRPNVEQLDWIEARARQAGSVDKVAWMRILVGAGGSARAIAVYRANAEPSPAMNEVYMAALSAIGNRGALAAAIRDELARASSATQLQRLAQLSERAGDTALEQQVLQKLVAAGGTSPSVHRRLGVLAYQRRDMTAAERELLAFTAATGGDYETRMLLGDLAMRRRDGGNARQHYAASLALVQTSGETSARAGAVKANLLHRLGRDAEASQLYETLLAAHPHDTNLRADYVAMLMEQGSLSQARAVLTNR
ncbi:MAG: hypothetical protein JO157_09015 [Acetobacteraceae bacterium]|nr:hypothetical protein [Acetobacteraceae bacterium]